MAGIALTTPGGRAQRALPADGNSTTATSFAILHSCAALPLGFFTYGGLIALQALWAGPG